MTTETLRRLLFALLVALTFGAFFVTQRLKHQAGIVVSFHAERFFSPLGKTHPVEHLSMRFKRTDEVTVSIVGTSGDDVVTLVRDRHVRRFRRLKLDWNGRLANGGLAADGTYRVRIRLRDQGRSVLLPRSFVLHATPPRPLVTAVSAPILPAQGPARIRFDLAGGRDPQALVYRTDVEPARLVVKLPVSGSTAQWDGRAHGRPVGPGTYLVAVSVTDRYGNTGSTPTALPPRRTSGARVPGRAGITVRYLGLEPPVDVVGPQDQVLFGVDARRRAYTWTLTRVGGKRPRKSGSSSRALLRMRPPSGSSGAFVLAVRSGSHSGAVPLLFGAARRERVLVVLPMISWLGASGVDDDGDGFPNTLDGGDTVAVPRVLAGGLPSGFENRIAPVLAFLDHRHLAYDVATDLGLAEHRGLRLSGHSGVLLVGDERWVPANLAGQLRAFVRAGGSVASLGVDSMLRSVAVSPGRLSSPTEASGFDVFGGRLAPLSSAPGPITNFLDRPGLFTGGGGQFGGYSSYQALASPGTSSKLVASAVTHDGRAAISAVSYGRGLLVRVGLPELPGRLRSDPDAAALLSRIWELLRR